MNGNTNLAWQLTEFGRICLVKHPKSENTDTSEELQQELELYEYHKGLS